VFNNCNAYYDTDECPVHDEPKEVTLKEALINISKERRND